jgi:hypothetical protein
MPLTLDALTLPDDLLWTDEYGDWSAIAQETGYTLGGALVIQEGTRLAGRPITLRGAETHGWATRAQVEALRAVAEAADAGPLTLTLPDGREFSVKFRRPAFTATPIIPYNAHEPGDYYALTVNLMETP